MAGVVETEKHQRDVLSHPVSVNSGHNFLSYTNLPADLIDRAGASQERLHWTKKHPFSPDMRELNCSSASGSWKLPWAWTPAPRNTLSSHTRWSPSRPAPVSWCRTGSLQREQGPSISVKSPQHPEQYLIILKHPCTMHLLERKSNIRFSESVATNCIYSISQLCLTTLKKPKGKLLFLCAWSSTECFPFTLLASLLMAVNHQGNIIYHFKTENQQKKPGRWGLGRVSVAFSPLQWA